MYFWQTSEEFLYKIVTKKQINVVQIQLGQLPCQFTKVNQFLPCDNEN